MIRLVLSMLGATECTNGGKCHNCNGARCASCQWSGNCNNPAHW